MSSTDTCTCTCNYCSNPLPPGQLLQIINIASIDYDDTQFYSCCVFVASSTWLS